MNLLNRNIKFSEDTLDNGHHMVAHFQNNAPVANSHNHLMVPSKVARSKEYLRFNFEN
jgi:hypothetical protein